ncbi:ABC transporter ATP-binding protein [Enterococcus phoeniculicola]|uniref:ABC transporter ATP-binding protein n=1 Tax=Enterococcus phoeniculicola TaxID=154621 RepID=UPI000554A5BC|nr:ABC transporter ATP-binding protein [Enterococcus phoeniculicola]
MKQAYYWHEFINVGFKKDSAKVISALSNDWKLLETNYFQLIFSIISNTMLFLVSLIYMMYVNSFISIFFIAFSFLPMIIPKLMKGKLVKYAKDWSIANEQYTKQIQYLKKYTK